MGLIEKLTGIICFNDDANVTRAMRRINEKGNDQTVTVIDPDTRQKVVIVDYDYFEYICNKSEIRNKEVADEANQ